MVPEMYSSECLLPLEERVENLIRRRHELDLQELSWAQDAAALAATDWYMEEGFATPLEWIRISCHLSAPQAADRVAVGEHVDEMPESFHALLAGEIGFSHLVVMARTAEALKRSRTAAPFEEATLVDKARRHTVGKLHHLCHHLRHAQDPEGYANAEADSVEARSLEITGGGEGWVSLKGVLDSAGAAVLRRALEPLARRSGQDDLRDRRRRLADALVELAPGHGRPSSRSRPRWKR